MSEQPPAPPATGLFEQLRQFPKTFWWANWIEVVERFSYYGLRTVLPIYMVLAYENGGPQLSHEQKGLIFAVWAMVQSFVPIFTGGFADRYGYKLNIAISTVIKIMGYLVMGWAIEIAAVPMAAALPKWVAPQEAPIPIPSSLPARFCWHWEPPSLNLASRA